MAVSLKRRIPAAVGIVVGALALVLPVSPAQAQVGPGAQATPIVGGPSANCPPGSPGAVVAVPSQTINGVTVYGPAGGQCTPLAATTSGEYTVAGVTSPNQLRFNAACANSGGNVTTNGFVDVPPGTTVNGVLFPAGTTVTTLNTPVVFPNGRTAIVNQVIVTPTTVTRNAIAFTGGPIVGRVICGAADVYPLAVDTAEEAAAAPELPITPTGDSGGVSGTVILLGAAFALAVIAQLTIGRKVGRRKGDATG